MRTITSVATWTALASTALTVALAVTAVTGLTAGEARAQRLEDVRDQGILYFKKEIYKQAKVRLDQAWRIPAGKKDFLTAYYRARTHYKLLLLETAFDMARRAEELAGGDEKRVQRAKELLGEMSGLYGGVTFKGAKGETNTQGRIFFEAKTGIINKSKKQRFSSIRERFRSTDVKLPTTVYLPYGDYLANKVPFAVKPDQPVPTVEIYLQVVVSDTDDDGIGMWGWIGIGGGAAVAAGVTAFFLLSGDDGSTPPNDIVFDIKPLTERP